MDVAERHEVVMKEMWTTTPFLPKHIRYVQKTLMPNSHSNTG